MHLNTRDDMFILETDRIHTQNLHSVSNRRLFRIYAINKSLNLYYYVVTCR